MKFSWPGKLFTRLKYPALKKQFDQARQYYAQLFIEPGGLVFDIGANVGDLSAVFLSMGQRVVACEPDPVNFQILKARFSRSKNITLLSKAVSHQSGEAVVYLSPAHGGSLSTLSKKRKEQLEGVEDAEGTITFEQGMPVETISLDAMISEFGCPCFIKIDVEGFEQEVLSGLSHPVPVLSFEANLPAFREETRQCLLRLKNLAPSALFNVSTDDRNLLFSQFQPYDYFVDWLENQEASYLDIFCRMEEGGKERKVMQ
ncbi:FkbM family methyltransferase [Flavihumibacter fluvii]|uniref:FkbM family methyltransferase n=1 Tax=Flavihumibacter fluvii TaxID=2838157 RepID=UPI001BDE0410|nr:FkbM family methyltransferase [Flavihumibacter fluvii]ULQ52993.1 FkbM family methyltransferase [Flavihumibacter fluvii]